MNAFQKELIEAIGALDTGLSQRGAERIAEKYDVRALVLRKTLDAWEACGRIHSVAWRRNANAGVDTYYRLCTLPVALRDVRQALEDACDFCGVTAEDVIGNCRRRGLARIRHAIVAAVRTSLRVSLSDMKRVVDRDHSTIIYACNHADPELAQHISDYLLTRRPA